MISGELGVSSSSSPLGYCGASEVLALDDLEVALAARPVLVQRRFTILVGHVLIITVVEQQPHHFEMALSHGESVIVCVSSLSAPRSSKSRATLRWPSWHALCSGGNSRSSTFVHGSSKSRKHHSRQLLHKAGGAKQLRLKRLNSFDVTAWNSSTAPKDAPAQRRWPK